MQFEELDYRPTPLGPLSLRRRVDPKLGEVFEIKLGQEYLMTSAFTESEIALARLALALLPEADLDVLVGGLGLGYTAQAVLEHDSVASLTVVEMLEPVIEWHRTGLLPIGRQLLDDTRTRIVQGDFFSLASGETSSPDQRFHAILVDIDHSPDALLDARSSGFYGTRGLAQLACQLHPGGIFGLWSNDRPDPAFEDRLTSVFARVWAEPVTFFNPLQDRPYTQTVYLARKDVQLAAGAAG